MKTIWIAVGAPALVCAAEPTALAENAAQSDGQPVTVIVTERRDTRAGPLRAPREAFELSIDGGYTQGLGAITNRRDINQIAGPGGTVGASLGYRVDPYWSIAATGHYERYAAGTEAASGSALWGVTAGFDGTVHLQPFARIDPFITLGGGYRAIIESQAGNGPTTVTHGFELGRLRLGLDIRPGESVALAPVIGGDLNVFPWRTGGGEPTQVETPKVNAFVFAGVQGRFDLGGKRDTARVTRIGAR